MMNPNYSITRSNSRFRQSGAALVIGLLLLLILTVLAVSGMNSASVEFIMAGNDQFHQNAFQNSETGIQQALINGTFNTTAAAPQVLATTAVANGTSADTYNASVQRQLNGQCTPPAPGGPIMSMGKFVNYHFEITSVGSARVSSQATHVQGTAVIAKDPGGCT